MRLILLVFMITMMLAACGHRGTLTNPDDLAAPSSSAPFAVNYGDVLEITVWGNDDMARRTVVRADGNISYPFVGDINVAGMTIPQVKATLTHRLVEYIPNAQVTVSLFESRSNVVYVVGKVQRPGAFPLYGPMTPIQAMAMAGGTTPFAKESSIYIVRTLKDGSQKSYPFNYNRVTSGNTEQNIMLQPGDTVVVP